MKIIKKNEINGLIENYIFQKLTKEEYEIKEISAAKLLTWNRFILSFNLFYLDNINKNEKLAKKIYYEMVRSTSLGKFIEPGNEHKNSMEKYYQEFYKTYQNIKNNGFDSNISLIPLSIDSSFLNGSHRVSSAIKLNKSVKIIHTELASICDDYEHLFKRNVPVEILDSMLINFLEYSENSHIAFLWPSAEGKVRESEKFFTNIVCKKEIKLTSQGAFNLLVELYRHMDDWVGTAETGFHGIRQKFLECFPRLVPLTIIVFQADSLSQVKSIKKSVRDICGIGYSSIHITDTVAEAINIANLIFNKNGLHFLNYANPFRNKSNRQNIEKIKNFIENNNISEKDIVIDGSFVLSLYGLRESNDIDYIALAEKNLLKLDINIESHDSEILYHQIDKPDLIYDEKYHFKYMGIKFVSLKQLFVMKENRKEAKDIRDCRLMEKIIKSEVNKGGVVRLKQYFFYINILIREEFKRFIFVIFPEILKRIRLYGIARNIYRYGKNILKIIRRMTARPRWHNFRNVRPISNVFALDRGTPIDRFYIEKFLDENKSIISGELCEIAEDTYSKRFGNAVKSIDVLHSVKGGQLTTIVGDLTRLETLPRDRISCFIATQTLNFIYDYKTAVMGIHQMLKPGGVALVTVSGISQISRFDMDRWGDYWRFTDLSMGLVFEEVFGAGNVQVTTYGNVLACIGFLEGICAEELTNGELSYNDKNYQLTIAIRAKK